MSSISPRWFHAAATNKDLLFLSGGTTQDSAGKSSFMNDMIALDLKRIWSTSSPSIVTLEPMTAPLSGHSMNIVQGTSQLLVAGGESSSPNVTPIFVYQFPSQSGDTGSWSAPPLTKNDTVTFHRFYHASISTGKDGALLHGGYLNSTASGSAVVSTLVTLKATNNFRPLTTTPVSLAPGAPALARHTMTMGTDGTAVILGGINERGIANLSIAYTLDTQSVNGQWEVQSLDGPAPEARMAFSTVLVNTTTMLVFGGTSDFKSAYSSLYYLDLPTWTWTSPDIKGDAPQRWGHSATMVGTSMVVAFGSSTSSSDTNAIAIFDTLSNTWTKQFRPVGMSVPADEPGDEKKGPSVGAILGIAFVVTVALVGGAFFLLVRRRKRRTRNTLARENMGDQTPRSAIKRQAAQANQGVFARAGTFLGLGLESRTGGSMASSKRYSDMPMYSTPMAISARMAQLGYSAVSLGYPETVVQHGCGQVAVSSYIYPKQACVETEKEKQDGQETLIVYHMLTPAQQEALKLSKQPLPSGGAAAISSNSKSKLYQLDT